MSQNIELALLTRVLNDRDFHSLERAQITEDFFSVPEAIEIYRYLRGIYHNPQTRGEVPSIEMLRTRFPGFTPFNTNDSVRILAEELRREKVRTDALSLSQNLREIAERDPLAAIAMLRTEASKMSALVEVTEDLTMAGAYSLLRAQYETISESGGVTGLPYPWHALNMATQGMGPGQLIYLFGRPKSMKTWIANYIAAYVYLATRGRVLYFTREMHPRQIATRMAACIAKVDYDLFKTGRLDPLMKEHVFQVLQELGEDEESLGKLGLTQPYIRIISDRTGGAGVSWLSAKIKEYRPDLLVVDGVYLMNDDRATKGSQEWQRVLHISRDLKLCAQENNIPIIGVTQATRDSEKTKSDGSSLADMAFSDALGQDGDAIFHVSKQDIVDERTKQQRTEITLRGTGIREGKLEGIVIHGCPATNFDFIRAYVAGSSSGRDDYQESKPKARFAKPMVDPRLPPPSRPG